MSNDPTRTTDITVLNHDPEATDQCALTLRQELWPSSSNFMENLPMGWFSDLARGLCHLHGLSALGGVMLPLTVIGSIAGSSVWVQGPDVISVPAPLNCVLVGATGSQFRYAADHAWLTARVGLAKWTLSSDIDSSAVSMELSTLEDALESRDQQVSVMPQPSPADDRLLKMQRYNLVKHIQELKAQAGRFILAEGCPVGCLLDPGMTAQGGFVHHLSTNGNVVPRLAALNKKDLADLSEFNSRLWTQRFFNPGDTDLPKMLSNTLVLSELEARQFLNDRHLQSAQYPDSFVFIDVRQGTSKHTFEMPATIPADKYLEFLNKLTATRVACGEMLYTLNKAAMDVYLKYVSSRHALAMKLGTARRAIFEHLDAVVLKCAASLHLIASPEEREISENTMKASCALSDAVFGSHLKVYKEFRSAPGLAETNDNSVDVEIIVARLRLRGSMSKRDLARSFHRQRYDFLEPLLSKALTSGVVVRTEDGRFALPGGERDVEDSRCLDIA